MRTVHKRPGHHAFHQHATMLTKPSNMWQLVAGVVVVIVVVYSLYLHYNPITHNGHDQENPSTSLGQLSTLQRSSDLFKKLSDAIESMHHSSPHQDEVVGTQVTSSLRSSYSNISAPIVNSAGLTIAPTIPVLGSLSVNGAKPLFGMQHKGSGDAIFALACNYPKLYYQRFVGTLRKVGYKDDIVLAVSPVEKMKPGVLEYVQETKVVAYGFDVDCQGKDNCKLKDDFLGYPDPRPFRTFANIRYALYEYWLYKGQYTEQSYILILDFRDTFFQIDPFVSLGPIVDRKITYDLRLFAENNRVKNIGKCVFNSLWISRCFGKEALQNLKEYPVLCSGSTYGSVPAIRHYVQTMLRSMDSVKCWLKGIESDQGYQNFLYYHGFFNDPKGTANATSFQQGEGVVNTIGAMNGFRVPKELKGPLDTFWKIRDSDGFILNYDGTKSSVVHQWDRWYKEIHGFLDTKLF